MEGGGREGGFGFRWAFAHVVILWDSLLSYKLSILCFALCPFHFLVKCWAKWEIVTLQRVGRPVRLSAG